MEKLKNYLPFIILSCLFVILYFTILRELVSEWYNDPNYSHGFLIPVISAYLIWQKKEELKNIKYQKSYLGLAILILGLACYIVGTAAAEFFSVRFSFILVLFGLIFYLFGKDVIKEIWFPVVFLFFMIPIPYVIYYAITFPLQLFSTKAATFLLQLTGFTILRQGNIIHLQNYSLEVVEACSGLRSLMTLSALGAAIAYLTQNKLFSGLLLFVLSVPIAIGANVIRILITAVGAMLISPKFAEGFLHEMSGLIVFMVGFISLGLSGYIINKISNWKLVFGD